MNSFGLRELLDRLGVAKTDGSAGYTADAAAAPAAAGATLAAVMRAVYDDSNELQTDWANGGRLDLLIDDVNADSNSLLVDTGDGTDAAVTAGNAGSLHAHIRDAQAGIDLLEADIGDASAGTLGSLTARIGDDAASRALHTKIGVGTEAVQIPDGTGDETIFGALRAIYAAVDTVESLPSTQAGIARWRPWQATAASSLTGNPTETALDSDGGVDGTPAIVPANDTPAYVKAHSVNFVIPAGAGAVTVRAVHLALHWRSKYSGNATAVASKWSANDTDTITAAVDVTDEVTHSAGADTYVEHTRSGAIKLSKMDNDWWLMLQAKQTGGTAVGGNSAHVQAISDSEIEIAYTIA